MTSAAGAEWLCAYTSEMVAVDISIDADSHISLNYNMVEKDDKQLGVKWKFILICGIFLNDCH